MYRLPVDLSRDGFYVIFDKTIEKRNLYFQTFEAFVEFCFKNPHFFSLLSLFMRMERKGV